MSFLDFYENVQSRFSKEGARELYQFLKEMGADASLVELSEDYKEFESWRDAMKYFGMSKAKILDEYLVIPCINDHVVIEIN